MKLTPYDIGCEPDPGAPGETLLQDGWKTYLLFFAVTRALPESGGPGELGVAVVRCHECVVSKFGYPNDEGRPAHPLYPSGMAEADSAVLEVRDSHWLQEVVNQKEAALRIRGWALNRSLRHFVIMLKEATFECIASALVVESCFETFDEAFTYVLGKLKQH